MMEQKDLSQTKQNVKVGLVTNTNLPVAWPSDILPAVFFSSLYSARYTHIVCFPSHLQAKHSQNASFLKKNNNIYHVLKFLTQNWH